MNFIKTQKNLFITLGGIALIGIAKYYFRGGMCNVNRDLTGQVVVVTGGNTGIGK